MNILDPYRAYCERRKEAHQFRQMFESQILSEGKVERGGAEFINFSSNDYLGLSQHPELITRAQDYAKEYGAGSTASRLISGNHPLYGKIEKRIAAGKGTEAALVMCSGYQANLTVIAALADKDALGKPVIVLADRLCHNSILQGVMLSGARLIRFQHNDYEQLEKLLREHAGKDTHVMIVTESVFGMDGDKADIGVLASLARQNSAMLYVDEAHATGLFGPGGFGLCAEHKGSVDVVMGTFGKALGSFGAYIACNQVVRDYLVQRCGGLIYSTALPPSVLGSIEAALDVLPQMNKERVMLQGQAARLRQALTQQGWDCGVSTTQIIPIILGQETDATELADILKRKGMLVPAIRPPTVPRGTSRLRISLSAAHKAEDIDRLIGAMGEVAAKFHRPQALAS